MSAISVIIPALDAADTLPAVLRALAPGLEGGPVGEVLVVDAGSRDATAKVARSGGARVISIYGVFRRAAIRWIS